MTTAIIPQKTRHVNELCLKFKNRKAPAILRYLQEAAPRPVPHEELFREIWQ